jgi:Zn-dependent protease with chaperone function
MKKLLIVVSFLFSPAIQAVTIYEAFDKLGDYADLIYSKGKLSEHDEQLFQKTAVSLGIEKRKIKARNSGLILRLLTGYTNALAVEPFNRVYLNAACLEKMTDEQKKFLMGHELSHLLKHDMLSRLVINKALSTVKEKIKTQIETPSPLPYRYFVEGLVNLPLVGIDLSITGLIKAQLYQRQETRADESAILLAGATAQGATEFLEQHAQNPNTKDWPLYAKVLQLLVNPMLTILCLPIIKQHIPHLASFNDRINHLKELEKNKTSTVPTAA